jgi:type VI secretion system secreted protein Hcp
MFIRTLKALTLAFLLLPITFSSHSKIFINYDGLSIKGDSQDNNFKDWIQIDSYQLGAGRAVGTPLNGSRDLSKVSLSEVTLTKQFDNSSVPLRQEIFSNQERRLVEIHFTRQGSRSESESYFIVRLNNVLLSSISASSGGDRPSESLSLNYTKIEWEYLCIDAQDTKCKPARGGYDLQTAKPF